MKRFCYKKWVRVCAVILCMISFNLMAGSFLVMMAGHMTGIYNMSEQEAWEDAKDSLCNKYSIRAAAGFREDFDKAYLQNTNFRYGVIQTDSIKDMDLNDKSIYEVCTFDKEVSEDMLYIHSYSLGDNTDLFVGESLFDNFFIYNSEGSFQTKKEPVEECFYARDTGRFYCLAGGLIFPITQYVGIETRVDSGEPDEWDIVYLWENEQIQEYTDLILPQLSEDGQITYSWANGQERLHMSGQIWYLADISIILQKELSDFGTVVSNDPDDSEYMDFELEKGYITTFTTDLKDTVPYYILSYVNEPLTASKDFFNQNLFFKLDRWTEQDFFVQSQILISLFFSLRYASFGILLLTGILFLASFCVLLIGAGHRDLADVTAGWMERIPLDVFAVIAAVLFMGIILAELYCIKVINHVRISLCAGIVLALFAELLALVCCMDAAIRLKLGKWWKNTLCWRIGTKIFRFLRGSAAKLQQAFPMIWKAWALMAALAVLELFGLSATSYRPRIRMTLWFLEKLVVYSFLTVCLLQMKKLQQAGKQLSAGELDCRIDTRRMLWDLKAHGDNLNHIREGIHSAVAEQLKSERFQTELITNVSHDIKTPLTSIINYVDLLEKEEIENTDVQEYIEVLSRQSKRLKKLIEDLMEASKASTGNLSVAWEHCDAQVMLTQTIGEFEEKLKGNQIELIVKDSGEPMVISADPRHLWRIFDNLMNNICKYAQPSTRAYVNMEKMERQGKIIFRNTSRYALNIDSEELMKRFVRGDSSRNTEGNGLGLSIAKSLTELMHGEFELVIDGDLFKIVITFPITAE